MLDLRGEGRRDGKVQEVGWSGMEGGTGSSSYKKDCGSHFSNADQFAVRPVRLTGAVRACRIADVTLVPARGAIDRAFGVEEAHFAARAVQPVKIAAERGCGHNRSKQYQSLRKDGGPLSSGTHSARRHVPQD